MRTRTSGPFVAAALVWLLGFPGVPSAGPQATQIPAEPALTAVDFLAIGRDGRPVTDLTVEQVSLKVDGRERPIRSLQFIDLGSGGLDRGGVIPKPLAPPFASNMLADAGRIVMIVINDESIRPGKERPAREAASRFLGALSSRDRVGLITLPRGSINVDLTRDHEQVRSALSRVTGQAPQTAGQAMPATPRAAGISASQLATSDRACSSRLTLNALSGMLGGITDMDGPKAVVFISSGLTPPTRDAPITGPPGQCEVKPEYYEEVGAASRAARAHFYVIQPSDLISDPAETAFADMSASRFAGTDDATAGLQNLVGVTGGEIFKLSGPADPVFSRVATESSGYYMAEFETEPDERNGLAHRVEIRVAKPDIALHYGTQLLIAKADARKDPKFLSPQDMLRGSRRFRTLPLRAMAFASGTPGSTELKVVAIAEPMDPSVALSSAAMGLVDVRGKMSKQWSANKEDLKSGMLVSAFPVQPGAYRLRVAAIDTAGRHGTVEYPIVAELTTAGSMKLSAIALGVSRNGTFLPKMIFADEPAAIAYLELYGRSPSPVVRLELAESEDGPALVSAPARLTETDDPERRIAVGALPLGGIFPGDYLVRAVVTNDGRPIGRAIRTLRKVVVNSGSR
jgi:VWFA-related protein